LSLNFQLQRTSHTALYLQIAEQIKDQICNNRLTAGVRLPTIRQLAQQLGVTRVTVQNAYDELQADGWIEATVGRGTFVSSKVRPRVLLPSFDQQITPDAVISDILQISDVVGIRSLASASPDPHLFPTEEFWGALGELRAEAEQLVSYVGSQGVPALRIEVARALRDRQIDVTPDDILITAGVTQGLSLVTQALCRPGDVVLVEQPTYLGFLHTLKTQGVQAVGVPLDDDGPQLEALERLVVQQRPRFFYTIPTFQNPTGICMSLARRQALLALARRHGFLLVEDDIYASMAYDQPAPPPLFALDETGSVVHMCSFSKIFMPGLRLAYVIAPPPLHQKLLTLRRASDLCSPAILQYALARFLASGCLKKHLRRVLPIYRERRDAYLAAMQRYMPRSVSWTRPAGGYCSWVTLPQYHAPSNVYQMAMQQGWVFAPGDAFLTTTGAHSHLRICFGSQTSTTIQHGVEALSQLIRQCLEQNDRLSVETQDWTPLV
jgi:DNA-binding transcriptional MocR family regulator